MQNNWIRAVVVAIGRLAKSLSLCFIWKIRDGCMYCLNRGHDVAVCLCQKKIVSYWKSKFGLESKRFDYAMYKVRV